MTLEQYCKVDPAAGMALRYFLRTCFCVGLISNEAWSHAWEASYGFRLKADI